MTKIMLRDTAAATPLTYTALRYFNVADADPVGRAGQSTVGATHLIKVAAKTSRLNLLKDVPKTFLAMSDLGCLPRRDSLKFIVRTALDWEKRPEKLNANPTEPVSV